jgi:5-methylcytosine-specific restriction endonuclease McrA
MDDQDLKFCKKCNRWLRLLCFGENKTYSDGLQPNCKECNAKAGKIYRDKTKDNRRKYEKIRRERETEGEKEKRNARRRELYLKDSKKRKDSNKKWKRNNKDKVAIQSEKRRARLLRAEGTFTSDEWNIIKKAYNFTCAYCGEEKKLSMDHVIPLSKGGKHAMCNIVPSCISCNSRKHVHVWQPNPAVKGFGIGYVVEKDDIIAKYFPVGFVAKTKEDCRKMAIAFARSVS